MKFLKLLIVFTLVLTSCQQNENLVDEQNPLSEIIEEAEGALEGDSDNDNNGDNGDNSGNNNPDEGSDNGNNGNDGSNGQDGNNPEETPGPPKPIDCSVFDGVFEFNTSRNQFVGVKTISISDIKNVKWTVNGTEVTPRTPRVMLVKDHVQQSGKVEICYEAESETCGKLSDCITVDFVK
ncbi:hypothetical protein [Tenacibaculum jejuense]|uniref:Probable lipoprotein n=1 Tax=Tenacibaculum jejuense TaxID=584609 RepID=A0A238U750_9FLAO|nr:hypothetical protein [Tenacibaculum jejuense]SNR14304.1 Probable lipoprotein precursor [Tenacibaculum jejuense]